MAATSLEFSKNATNRYETSFVSEGAVVIQVERAGNGYINVYANLDGMSKTYIGGTVYSGNSNLIFSVDVPAGVTVTIESLTEVVSAKMLSNG